MIVAMSAATDPRPAPRRARDIALWMLASSLAHGLGSQRASEVLTGHLNRIFHAVIAELDRFGGEVIYFSGDAITCWLDGDDGLRADRVRAGPLNVGQSFGPRYHIIKLLGVGGMGAVYQAWDSELNVVVALKVIRSEASLDRRAAEIREKQFKTELLLARQVTHPNVSRIFDIGKHAMPDGSELTFFTMELIDGESLADRLRSTGRVPLDEALPIVCQILSGVAAAHHKGIVHRDLKPSNVMLEPGDGEPRIVVTDFGIAYRGSDEATSALYTGEGDRMVGSPAYMAPEQMEGAAVSARTDIFIDGVRDFEPNAAAVLPQVEQHIQHLLRQHTSAE